MVANANVIAVCHGYNNTEAMMRIYSCRAFLALFLFLISILPAIPGFGQGTRTLPAPDEYMRLLGKSQTWQVREGEFVVLHYLLKEGEVTLNDDETVRQKIQGVEDALARNGAVLNSAPLSFKIPIYLFPSPEAHAKAFGVRKPVIGGATQFQTITCVDGPWSTIRSTMTHELAHMQIRHSLADPLPDFLQEGLACYVQRKTDREKGPEAALKHPLFYITTHKPLSDFMGWPSDRLERMGLYEHAASWIEFLLNREADSMAGWAKMKAYCVAVSHQMAGTQKGKTEQRIERALQSVYGLTRVELEKEWRRQIPQRWNNSASQLYPAFLDPGGVEGFSQWTLHCREAHVPWVAARWEQNRVRLAVLRWTDEGKERGFIAQFVNLERYQGKRLRFTLVTERNDCPMGNLFINVWSREPATERFFYMRMLKVSREEATYTVTVDVPKSKSWLTWFGVVLNQAGEVIIKSLQVTEVDSSIPTDKPDERGVPKTKR